MIGQKTCNLLLLTALLGLLGAGCLYDPSYNGTHCGPGNACPGGYSCDVQAKICVPDDGEFTQEEPPLDGGEDGGQDGADDPADGDVDPADGDLDPSDGDVDPADGDDDIPDGDDDQPDGGDDQVDEGPCPGGCQAGQWCDLEDNQCKSCSDPDHCGPTCAACAEGQLCNNMELDGMCCMHECQYENSCELLDCNGTTYLCKAFFPLTYEWIKLADASAMICALSDQSGIVDDAYQCDPLDGSNLLYFCPWSGTCNADGTCHVDMAYKKIHSCEPRHGCLDGRCRTYLTEGQECEYNFDCESFCCAKGSNGVCLDGSDVNLCKIPSTFYRSDWSSYTWHAMAQTQGDDHHDLNNWYWEGGINAPECSSNGDCDSGHCETSIYYSNKRCSFPGCISDGEASTIRANYFCDSAEDGHAAHINVVTNHAPWPEEPNNCVYE